MGGDREWTIGCCLAEGSVNLPLKSSTLVTVQSGDHLTATIRMVGRSGNKFRYQCFFEEHESATFIDTASIGNIEELYNCCGTLEVKRHSERLHYPPEPSVLLSDISIMGGSQPIHPNWEKDGFPRLHESAQIVNGAGGRQAIELIF